MTGRGLCLLLLLAPATAAAASGRVAFSALAGGGYASDAFIGASLGPDAVVQVTPSARLDLSLAPEWKLGAVAELSYGRYLDSEFTAVSESGALEARWLRGPVDASLALGGDHTSYSQGAPLDPTLVTSPSVSDTSSVRASPLVRVQALGLEWRGAGLLAWRTSTRPSGGPVPERDRALLVGVLRRFSPRFSGSATYRLAHTSSDRADFTLTGHALFLNAAVQVGWETALEAQLQLQIAQFATGAEEDLARATLQLTRPLSDRVDVEIAYSFAGNHSTDPLRPSATRHFAFAGLRVRLGEVTW